MSDKAYTARDIEVLCSSVENLKAVVSKQSSLIGKLLERPSINLERLYVNKSEAAYLLGKSPRWIDDAVSDGKLSTVRDSRSRMFSVDELRNLPLVRVKQGNTQFEIKLQEIGES
tara:strand:+ start:331 stop:675 length:345 start_codon:yes stop_codon:yes gene_type:complete